MKGSEKNVSEVLWLPEDLILLFWGNGSERRGRGQKLSAALFTRLLSGELEVFW